MTSEHERETELWLLSQEIFVCFPDACLIVDETMIIQHANKMAGILFGYAGMEGDMIGQPVSNLTPDDIAHLHPQYMKDYMEKPQARPMGVGLLVQGKRRSGVKFYCEIALVPLMRSAKDQRRILARIIPRDPPPHVTLVTKVEELEAALQEATGNIQGEGSWWQQWSRQLWRRLFRR